MMLVQNEGWLVRNNLLCNLERAENSISLTLKNIGPTRRVIYKDTTVARLEEPSGLSTTALFTTQRIDEEVVTLEDHKLDHIRDKQFKRELESTSGV